MDFRQCLSYFFLTHVKVQDPEMGKLPDGQIFLKP
jgi:hypothetical protein